MEQNYPVPEGIIPPRVSALMSQDEWDKTAKPVYVGVRLWRPCKEIGKYECRDIPLDGGKSYGAVFWND